MKNKEIEELLNELKRNADKHFENPLKYTKEYKDYVLSSYIEQLENNRDKAIEYMQDFIFEPLLVQEDRKLIMFNENLRNFEKILKGDSDESR